MKCPHCLVDFHDEWNAYDLEHDVDGRWIIRRTKCPSCKRFVLYLHREKRDGRGQTLLARDQYLIRPRTSARPCPPEVPSDLAEDFGEACLVLSDSPKASAALSRRCLQHLLREHAGVKHGNLANEIDQVLASGSLPPALSDSIDAIRNIGNASAHPMKSNHTGEVMPVEPGEAEWTLDVLEELFDFYFVAPERLRQKRAALDAKLAEAGRPLMKGMPSEEDEADDDDE